VDLTALGMRDHVGGDRCDPNHPVVLSRVNLHALRVSEVEPLLGHFGKW
jgi:hypothetical protein